MRQNHLVYYFQQRNLFYIINIIQLESENKMFNVYRIFWNWKTPTGYFGAISVQFAFLFGGVFVAITPLLTFAAFCMLIGALITDIKKELFDLNNVIINQHPVGIVNSMQLKKRLCDIIEIHYTTKQLS